MTNSALAENVVMIFRTVVVLLSAYYGGRLLRIALKMWPHFTKTAKLTFGVLVITPINLFIFTLVAMFVNPPLTWSMLIYVGWLAKCVLGIWLVSVYESSTAYTPPPPEPAPAVSLEEIKPTEESI